MNKENKEVFKRLFDAIPEEKMSFDFNDRVLESLTDISKNPYVGHRSSIAAVNMVSNFTVISAVLLAFLMAFFVLFHSPMYEDEPNQDDLISFESLSTI